MTATLVLVGIIAFVNAIALAFLGQRVLAFLGVRWDRHLSFSERTIALQERQYELRSRSISPPAIPADLVRRITRWVDPTAQESERAVILGLYDECRDQSDPWASVRKHLPPEPADEYVSPLLS